jgi:membrane fusion protein, copper/silver efflux system
MSRAGRTGLTFAAVLAGGAGGYWAGQHPIVLPPFPWLHAVLGLERTAAIPGHADAAALGPVIYYRDPDGRPVYSADPRSTADGRAFAAVYASEDISFEELSEVQTSAPALAGGEPKKVLYYRNPMGLPDTSPVPKKDSMGMDYIPVYDGEDKDDTTFRLAPGKLQRTGVRTESVSNRIIVRPLRAPGTVQPDERNVSVVTVAADSYVIKVENVTTGQRPAFTATVRMISVAAVEFQIGLGSENARRHLENLAVPAEVIAEIERTHQVPHVFTWYAPRDGVVLMRNATEGMKMAAGDVLFRIADLSTVWVLADVPEYALASVEPGQAATIRVRSLPGRNFDGRVALIYPQVNKETRTTKVRIVIPNPDGVLRPDMYADVEVATGGGKPVVAVPNSAVIDTGTRQIVILDKGDGRFEPREVKIGAQGGGYTEVRDGLVPGDRIVVAENFLIDAESNLKAALKSMATAEGIP